MSQKQGKWLKWAALCSRGVRSANEAWYFRVCLQEFDRRRSCIWESGCLFGWVRISSLSGWYSFRALNRSLSSSKSDRKSRHWICHQWDFHSIFDSKGLWVYYALSQCEWGQSAAIHIVTPLQGATCSNGMLRQRSVIIIHDRSQSCSATAKESLERLSHL